MVVLSELICLGHGWLRGSNIGTCSEKIALASKPLPPCSEGSKMGGNVNLCFIAPILELIYRGECHTTIKQLKHNLLVFTHGTMFSIVTIHR